MFAAIKPCYVKENIYTTKFDEINPKKTKKLQTPITMNVITCNLQVKVLQNVG